MCWSSYKRFIYRKIAKEDITCYKIFSSQRITYRKKYLFFGERKISSLDSFIMDFKYVPYQKQVHVDLHVDKRLKMWPSTFETYYAIEEGYHSYATLCRADKHHKVILTPSVIIECIIPKDAEYFINDDDEIVSSTIIVTDKIIE